MDQTKSEMLEKATKMMSKLDDKSLFLTVSQMNVLLARQELEKGADNVAESNCEVGKR